MAEPEDSVRLHLTGDEVTVLSDWLQQLDHVNYDFGAVEFDHADWVALTALTAALEPLIDHTFSADYDDVVRAAKERLTSP